MKKIEDKASTIVQNNKASYNYTLKQKYIAGLCLKGWEVKSLRAKQVNITEAYISFKNGEAWLVNCDIVPLSTTAHQKDITPKRLKKLLLNKREIDRLRGEVQEKNLTVIPLALIWQNQHIKAQIALAQGKKKYDKRLALKEKEWKQTKLLRSV